MIDFLRFLFAPFRVLINFILVRLNIFIVYRFGNAIGDQLCMSAIAKEINAQNFFKVVVLSSYPECFLNNPYVWKNIDIKEYSIYVQRFIVYILSLSKGSERIENFCFPVFKCKGLDSYMRDSKAKISLIEAHALHFKLKLDLKNTKPDIFFSSDECDGYFKKFGNLEKYAVIQPIGKVTYTPNKEWGFEKYQELVNKTKENINWVQTGFKDDKLLKNVIDMRGETSTLRELAYVIKEANFTLSNEGLLNHLAASVNTESFVIFSGFHQIEIALYSTTKAIFSGSKIDCSPCCLLEKCPQNKICIENISVADVMRKLLNSQQS